MEINKLLLMPELRARHLQHHFGADMLFDYVIKLIHLRLDQWLQVYLVKQSWQGVYVELLHRCENHRSERAQSLVSFLSNNKDIGKLQMRLGGVFSVTLHERTDIKEMRLFCPYLTSNTEIHLRPSLQVSVPPVPLTPVFDAADGGCLASAYLL